MALHVADIILPGASLKHDPSWTHDTERDIEALLRTLLSELDCCAVALGLFEGAGHPSKPSREEWERERSRARAHEEALVAAGITLSHDEMHLRVKVDLSRADWKNGVTPRSYQHNAPFMHAELFVAHVDMILKVLKKISTAAPSHSVKLDAIAAKLERAIGGAKDVRDSHQHRDERVLGEARGKPIVAQPMSTSGIHAPGGMVISVGNLFGNRLGYTAADGSYAEVEVSAATLTEAQGAVQAAHDAFAWEGSKRYHPSW